jgi:hypothetical protein
MTTTRLAIVCDLDVWANLCDEYVTERGNKDDCRLIRQLVVSDLIEWLQQRQEVTTDGNRDNSNY